MKILKAMAGLKLIFAALLPLVVSAVGPGIQAAPGPEATKPGVILPRPEALADPLPLVLTPGDVARHAIAVARSVPDVAERADALLRLGRAEARRGETAAAGRILRLAVRAAASIPPNARYTFPHPIIRIAEAQAEAGDPGAARQTFRKAVGVIEAEDDHHQVQNWVNMVPKQLRSFGRVSPETVAGYRRFLGRDPHRTPQSVIPLVLKLQAASGNTRDALRAVTEGAEFAGPEGASLRRAALLGILGAVMPGDNAAAEVLEEAKRAVNDRGVLARGPGAGLPRDVLAIARAEARLGRLADAVRSARSMRTEGLPARLELSHKFNQAQTFAEIAREQARAGDKAGAVTSAREVIAIIDTIQDESYKTYPLYQAGEALVEAGELAEARQLAAAIKPRYRALLRIKIAEARRAEGDRASALEDLRQALRASEEHLTTVGKRPPPGGKAEFRERAIASATHDVARLQARLGDLTAALRSVATIADAEGRDNALAALATSRAGEGDLGTARDLIARIESPEARGNAWVGVACALPAPLPIKGGRPSAPGH